MTNRLFLAAALIGLFGTACEFNIGVPPDDDGFDICTLDWKDGCKKPDKPGGLKL